MCSHAYVIPPVLEHASTAYRLITSIALGSADTSLPSDREHDPSISDTRQGVPLKGSRRLGRSLGESIYARVTSQPGSNRVAGTCNISCILRLGLSTLSIVLSSDFNDSGTRCASGVRC